MNVSPFSWPIVLGHTKARGRCSQGERVLYGRDLCRSGGTGKAEAAKLPGAGIGPKQCPEKCAAEKGYLPKSDGIMGKGRFEPAKCETTPTKIPSGGQSKRLQGHFVAQAFQPPDQGPADAVHVDAIKVIRTEFPVVFLTLQHVIRNLHQCMCYPHNPALGSPPSTHGPIPRRPVVVLQHLHTPP